MGMTSAVWKYPLEVPLTTVAMPMGARVLHVGAQGDVVTLWALVEPDRKLLDRQFLVVGTGWEFDLGHPVPDAEYRGTALRRDGLVFHVFERVA